MSSLDGSHKPSRGGPLTSVTDTATTITDPNYTTPGDSLLIHVDVRKRPTDGSMRRAFRTGVSDTVPSACRLPAWPGTQTVVPGHRTRWHDATRLRPRRATATAPPINSGNALVQPGKFEPTSREPSQKSRPVEQQRLAIRREAPSQEVNRQRCDAH